MVETRKVQITGGSTYIVSLPKSWAKERDIKAGDPLIVAPRSDGTVVISSERDFEKKVSTKYLELRLFTPTTLIRALVGTYMAGYTMVELMDKKGISPEMRTAIMRFTRMVIGPEIIEESETRVILKDLIDPSEFSQRKGLRRMYLIVKKMHEDAISSFYRGDLDLARDVIDRDSDVDRLYWMITKHYNMLLANPKLIENLDITRERSLSYMLVSRSMERIGDHAVRIARNTMMLSDGFRKGLKDDIIHESELAIDILGCAADSFFQEDLDKANQSIDMRDKLEEMNDKLMKAVKEERKLDVTPLSYILESISRTGSYATDISEISINYIMSG